VKIEDYAGIIMPCMAVGLYPGPQVSREAVAIVKQAVVGGKPVAAQAGSVIILAEAGVLKDKRYAFTGNPLKTTPRRSRTDPRFAGAGIYSGLGVVQDGKIITSGVCPYIAKLFPQFSDGTPELTKKFISALTIKQ
jgi:putative intracellular protease/amidase